MCFYFARARERSLSAIWESKLFLVIYGFNCFVRIWYCHLSFAERWGLFSFILSLGYEVPFLGIGRGALLRPFMTSTLCHANCRTSRRDYRWDRLIPFFYFNNNSFHCVQKVLWLRPPSRHLCLSLSCSVSKNVDKHLFNLFKWNVKFNL